MTTPRRKRKKQQPVPCVHCGEQRTVWRRRGLCWQCFKSPTLRERYKCRSRYAKRYKDTEAQSKPPPPVKESFPGTAERIREMMRRVAKRQSTSHPDDRRFGDGDLT